MQAGHAFRDMIPRSTLTLQANRDEPPAADHAGSTA